MGCITPVSICAILAIIALASGQWGAAIVLVLLAIPAGAISAAGRKKKP